MCQHVLMAASTPFDHWWPDEWKRAWTELVSLSGAAGTLMGMPFPLTLPGDPFGAIVDAVRARLIGKNRTFLVKGHDLTMVLDDISVEGTDLARSMGQYGEVRIAGRDIEWESGRLDQVEIRARNVHLWPGASPTLVAAPVLWEVDIPASFASSWLATVEPRFDLAIGVSSPHIGLAGRAAPWARLEVEAAGEGRSILLRPRALRVGSRRLPLRLPAYHVSLAASLPSDVVLTSVEPHSAGVVMRGFVSEWRRSLSQGDVERFVAALRTGQGRIDI
jgi:hypothetical protein